MAHEVQPEIGLDSEQRGAVIEILNKRLSDVFTLYTKTRKYHWNVVGIHFHSLHELFEDQYELLDEAMDEVAERVRQLGGISFGTMDEFRANTALKETPGHNPEALDMVRDLLSDHEAIIRQLRADVDTTADDYGDMGTSDFLTAQMEAHEKMAWMLRAHLADTRS